MDSPCIKQTVCKVLNRFQHEKYLVAYVLKLIVTPKYFKMLFIPKHIYVNCAMSLSYQNQIVPNNANKKQPNHYIYVNHKRFVRFAGLNSKTDYILFNNALQNTFFEIP